MGTQTDRQTETQVHLLSYAFAAKNPLVPLPLPVVCDCGVVAAVVLGLGHRHFKGVEVSADHVGSQTRHFNRCLKFSQSFYVRQRYHLSHFIIIVTTVCKQKFVKTVSVEGDRGLVNTGKCNVPRRETFYDGTLPKHTFQ